MEDGKGNKTITTLLFYNGPNLTEIYSLKETAQYLRKARLGQRSPLSVNEKRLEQIRQDLLDILVDSEAATSLLFYNGPDLTGLCSLVLNAAQSPDSIIAPRIEVPVPQQTGGE